MNAHLQAGPSRFALSPAGTLTPRGRTLQVRTVCSAAAQAAPGGGEVQCAETSRALRELGLDVQPWDGNQADLRQIDVLHLFGSLREELPLAISARKRGVAVAVSPIAWFDLESRWHEAGSLASRLIRCGKLAAGGALPWIPSWRKRLYAAADVLLPNSKAEAAQLSERFGLAIDRVTVVPNGASPRFAGGDPQAFAATVGGQGYVLVPGRIEPRKNQLSVIKALRDTNLRLVILGDPVPGHEDYAAQCRAAANDRVTFVPRIPHEDARLASAYAGCGCVALFSWFETPGLVALEAAMGGVPVALTNRGCTREYFGTHATYAAPNDALGMRAAVKTALGRGRDAALAEHVQNNYSWQHVAAATFAAYEQVLWQRAPYLSFGLETQTGRAIA